jgi:hypothetical protein
MRISDELAREWSRFLNARTAYIRQAREDEWPYSKITSHLNLAPGQAERIFEATQGATPRIRGQGGLI